MEFPKEKKVAEQKTDARFTGGGQQNQQMVVDFTSQLLLKIFKYINILYYEVLNSKRFLLFLLCIPWISNYSDSKIHAIKIFTLSGQFYYYRCIVLVP